MFTMADSRKCSDLISYDHVLQPSGSVVYSSEATSPAKLAAAEEKILSSLPEVAEHIQRRYVCIKKNHYVWTLCLNSSSTKSSSNTPVVLLHGVATGSALWVLNLAKIAAHRTVYAIDMLGFGRSSRVTFSVDPVVAEMELVESLEAWRHSVGLDTFILVGHCFGGYIGTSYAIRYPSRVRHLMLVDPWGFSEKCTNNSVRDDKRLPMPLWVRTLALLIQPFNPFAALRMAGGWGPALVARFKPDLIKNYEHLFNDQTVAEYIYHWNAQLPSGESAFKHMSYEFGWARYPMINRVKDVAAFTSMSVICGTRSFIDTGIGQKIVELRRGSYVDVHTVFGAGHFVFADKAELFDKLVHHTCSLVDHRLDVQMPHSNSRSRLRRVRSECGPTLCDVPSSPMVRRRCDSHVISEETETPSSQSVGSACLSSFDASPHQELPSRPVFGVGDDDDY